MRFLLFLVLLLAVVAIPTSADLSCDILTSCPAGSTALLYLENDTGGFDDAHAELPSSATSPYVLCCNSTASPITTTCGVTFLKLSDESNAHVHDPSYEGSEDYPFNACINADTNVSCTISTSGCSSDKTCLVSMESDETTNLSNAHVGSCKTFDTDVCCSVNSYPNNVSLYSPGNGATSLYNNTPTFTWYNTTDPDSSSLTYQLQVDQESSGFQNPIIDASDIPEGSDLTSYTTTSELTLGIRYIWRVRAFDGLDYGNWSDNWTFMVSTQPAAAGGVGGGGGGGNLPQTTTDFEVQPPLIKTVLKQGETKQQPITLRNTGTQMLNIKIDPRTMSRFITPDPETITLKPGEEKQINLIFTASNNEIPDVHTGRIFITAENIEKSLLTIIDIMPKIALFDINITIPNKYREITPGDQILAKIDISNFGDLKGIDININYIIKDDENNIIFMRDEMMAIQDFISIERIIPTSQNIKTGTHVLIIRVTYGNYTGIASETFNIKPKEEKPTQPSTPWTIIILISLVITLSITTAYLLIRKKRWKQIHDINVLIRKAHQEIIRGNLKSAEGVYISIKPLYASLEDKDKQALITKIVELYSRIRNTKRNQR